MATDGIYVNTADSTGVRRISASGTIGAGQLCLTPATHHWGPVYPYGPGQGISSGYITVASTPAHRLCSCPKCPGDCCPCADCEVGRLKKRVAELERERDQAQSD